MKLTLVPRTLRTYFDPNNHNARKKGNKLNQFPLKGKVPGNKIKIKLKLKKKRKMIKKTIKQN